MMIQEAVKMMSKYCSGCLPGEVHYGLFMPPGKYLKSNLSTNNAFAASFVLFSV